MDCSLNKDHQIPSISVLLTHRQSRFLNSWLLELPTGTNKVFELNLFTILFVNTMNRSLENVQKEKGEHDNRCLIWWCPSINCPVSSSLVQLLLIRMICASEIDIIIQHADVWHLARHYSECTNVCVSIPPGFQRGFYACWNPKGCICRVFRNSNLCGLVKLFFGTIFENTMRKQNFKKNFWLSGKGSIPTLFLSSYNFSTECALPGCIAWGWVWFSLMPKKCDDWRLWKFGSVMRTFLPLW